MGYFKDKKISRRNVLKIGAVGAATLSFGTIPKRVAKSTSQSTNSESSGQLGFLYDQGKCVECRVCQAACKETNGWDEDTEWRRVLSSETKAKTYLSISCNHCENPACMTVCPVAAYEKREKDGLVIHDPDVCIGCKYCMYACPYHAPQFSDETGRITKCHFCYERQENNELPACVEHCPTGALDFGILAELREEHGDNAYLDGLPDPEITKPSWVVIPK